MRLCHDHSCCLGTFSNKTKTNLNPHCSPEDSLCPKLPTEHTVDTQAGRSIYFAYTHFVGFVTAESFLW